MCDSKQRPPTPSEMVEEICSAVTKSRIADPPPEPLLDHEVMKVYEIELGATYWIYAENFMQALNYLYEVLNIEVDCDEKEVTIITLDEKQLKEKIFRDEQGPKTIHTPFIDYVKTLDKPQMFACTDF